LWVQVLPGLSGTTPLVVMRRCNRQKE